MAGAVTYSNEMKTPAAEVQIDEHLVRRLLLQQHPDLASLSLRELDVGWDNAMFRLGEDLCVRLPRRTAAATLIEHEQRWLPQLAPSLPLRIPAPLAIGQPTPEYPWRWSIVPWLAGTTAESAVPGHSEAASLASFLRALHRPAPADAPRNAVRGVALCERAEAFEQRMSQLQRDCLLEDVSSSTEVRRLWESALRAPIDYDPTWIHGDLHPRNVLVDRGRISGIIDWGDIAVGDCATDLAAVWMLFENAETRQAMKQMYAIASPATWSRARGWAVLFGVTLLLNGLTDNARHALIGKRTLRAVIAE